ncbi:NAD/NADP octopine/nopaline dehydrogenase family protein [Candidatus Uhrbacteria bacterium]|nr:NAD/NADP octopine/nopaline dehydrogenase family protein [Candidatus Uhrbacteria bacterium]
MPHILIIGAGAAGTTIAAHLSSNGYRVTLSEVPGFIDRLDNIRAAGKGVRIYGMLRAEGFVAFAADLSQVEGVDFVVVTTVADAHKAVADMLAPVVDAVRAVLYFPGNLGSLFLLRRLGSQARVPLLVEANTLPYGCRISPHDAEVARVTVLTPSVLYSGDPSSVPELAEMLAILTPNPVFGGTVQSVLLSNPNPLFHTTPCLLSASRIELDPDFRMYEHGVTPGVRALLGRKDAERMTLLAEVEGRGLAWNELRGLFSKSGSMAEPERQDLEFLACGRAAGFKGPNVLEHRYLTEDTAAGLVCWERIGELTSIPTPIVSAEITLISALLGRDFRTIGRERANLL